MDQLGLFLTHRAKTQHTPACSDTVPAGTSLSLSLLTPSQKGEDVNCQTHHLLSGTAAL